MYSFVDVALCDKPGWAFVCLGLTGVLPPTQPLTVPPLASSSPSITECDGRTGASSLLSHGVSL